MNPAEAGAVQYEEPDWRDVFEEQCARKALWPRYLQEVDAYEATLTQWRQFHWTPTEDDKKRPAPATDAIIALAGLGIMAPRSEYEDAPRGEPGGWQCDDHMWLSINGEQWRITAIEDRMLCLEKGFQDVRETRQIDLNRTRWDDHIAAAVAVLEAMRVSIKEGRASGPFHIKPP